MSRVGRMPVKVPEKVKVSVDGNLVKVEGPKGKMSFPFNPRVAVAVEKGEVKVTRPDETRLSKGLHGLTRTLVKNAVEGVVKGYEKNLEISGVGFKAEVKGKNVHFTLGFSHPVVFNLPEGITAEVDAKQTKIALRGVDKHLLGLTAAKIRDLRPPEPYKGKGVRYLGEKIRSKAGKQGATA